MDDKTALKLSSAGMRLIAQTTLYNRADWHRLGEYIRDGYAPATLEAQPQAERIAGWQRTFEQAGRLKVKQVLATDKHQVIVALEAERGGMYYAELKVEEDYPHRVTHTLFTRLQEVES